MTDTLAPVDDLATLRRVFTKAEVLLLDFDGPVCAAFEGVPAPLVADQLREVLAQGGHTELPQIIKNAEDPFDVFEYAATLGPDEASYVEASLRAHEMESVESASPTKGSKELLQFWKHSRRQTAIVSNNSEAAIQSYLYLHDLTPYVDWISARTSSDPKLLKPNPFLLYQAASQLSVTPAQCLIIGDSMTDIEAGIAAGCKVVAFANKPNKVNLFTIQPVEGVITTINLANQAISSIKEQM